MWQATELDTRLGHTRQNKDDSSMLTSSFRDMQRVKRDMLYGKNVGQKSADGQVT